MAEKLITTVVTIFVAIIGVAVIALLVSKKSDTVGVIAAGSGGFADALCAAVSPLGINCGRKPIESVDSNITFGGPSFGSMPLSPISR